MNDIKINELPPLLKPHMVVIKDKSPIERWMITATSYQHFNYKRVYTF